MVIINTIEFSTLALASAKCYVVILFNISKANVYD